MSERKIYVDFDRFPGVPANDPLKRISEKDVEQIQKWVRREVSKYPEVYAIITGRASRFCNIVAAAELSLCGNVTKIGWAQSGMIPIVAKDFRESEN